MPILVLVEWAWRCMMSVMDAVSSISSSIAEFESGSTFREAFTKLFGFPPGKLTESECLCASQFETPLDFMVALADDRGLHVLDFVDRRRLERRNLTLGALLTCAIVPGNHVHLDSIAMQLQQYFTVARLAFDVPLVLTGSPWEQRVWRRLLTIPRRHRLLFTPGQELGQPQACRAVGRANGMNYLAIVVPCHRVILADGSLCGHGWGLWRKQWLLDHERRSRPPSS